MTDLDFDELDRAVNSLIVKEPATNEPSDVQEKVLTLNDDIASLAVSSPSTLVTTATAEAAPGLAEPLPQTPTLATRRSSGRFMDVVRPSATMRPTETTPTPLSRQGVTIPSPYSTPVAESTQPTSATDTPPTSSADWPDPLDFNAQTTTSATALETPTEPSEDVTTGALADEGLASPFLPDMKVDKRPLGAFSADLSPAAQTFAPSNPLPQATPAVDAPIEPQTVVDESTDDPQVTEPDTILPEELQSDLLSIESNDTTEASEPAAWGDRPAAQSADATPSAPTAITQQYSETPNTGDQKSGAIFDTAAYHKPLNHPLKKKSGWLWIVWILLLLVLGAGVGAAVYFFVLPKF